MLSERKRAEAHYLNVPVTKNIEFSAYSDESIKDALNELFGGKCAYCEGVMEATQPMDIEHFRPKGGVVDDQGKIKLPGYWWLASEWANLLPSCLDCNRSRHHREKGQRVGKYGKENLFPLPPGQARATAPGQELSETPLLIDPAAEEPRAHICFEQWDRPGERLSFAKKTTTAVIERADASILTYGLNRPTLMKQRGATVSRLALALLGLERRWFLANKHLPSPLSTHILIDCRLTLREIQSSYLGWRNPYSAACLDYYMKWKIGLKKRGSKRT